MEREQCGCKKRGRIGAVGNERWGIWKTGRRRYRIWETRKRKGYDREKVEEGIRMWKRGRYKDVGKRGEEGVDGGSEKKEGYRDGKRGRERHEYV